MEEEKEVRRLLVDPSTGSVTDKVYVGDKILRGETIEYMQNTMEIGKGENFVKWFGSAMADIRKEDLTKNQWKLLTLIIEYLRYESGLVAYDNGKPLYLEDMAKMANMSIRTAFDAMEKLITKKIIGKFKTGFEIKYYVNPFIFCKGMRIEKTLYSMFKSSKWCSLHKNTPLVD